MENNEVDAQVASENIGLGTSTKNDESKTAKPAKTPKVTEADFENFQAFFEYVTADFKKHKKLSVIKFCAGKSFEEKSEILPPNLVLDFWKIDKQLDIPLHFIKEISASGNSSPYLDSVMQILETIICKHPVLTKFSENSLTDLDFKKLEEYLLNLSFLDVEMQDSALFTKNFRESLRKNISGSVIHLNIYRGKWKLLEAISAAGNSIWYKSSSSAELAPGKVVSSKEVSAIGAVYRKLDGELRREQLKLEKLSSELVQQTQAFQNFQAQIELSESQIEVLNATIESFKLKIENLTEEHKNEKTMLSENGIKLSSDLNNFKGRVKTSLESSLDSRENGLHALQSGKTSFAENFMSETIEKIKKHLKEI